MRLLIVEDAHRLRDTLGKALGKLGHAVDLAPDGEVADDLVQLHEYDAIVLDIMLPKKNGLVLLHEWRARGDETPILLLTALDQVEDRVRGLSLGADDYLVKPFALAELAARLEVLIRRRYGQPKSQIRIGPLLIDVAAKTVRRDGVDIDLTAREFALLEYFARHHRQVLSRSQIEAHLYDEQSSPMSNAVDSAVCSLRRKICPSGTPSLIRTRRGLGYVLDPS